MHFFPFILLHLGPPAYSFKKNWIVNLLTKKAIICCFKKTGSFVNKKGNLFVDIGTNLNLKKCYLIFILFNYIIIQKNASCDKGLIVALKT